MDRLVYEKAVQLRHELHTHPELSGQERWTKQRLIEFLRENTKLEIVDCGNWFYAVYRAPGKEQEGAIAFRADYDAVAVADVIEKPYASAFPGIGHKCGHDGHAASLAALAILVSANGAPRNVVMLFQPAEETGEGALICTELFDQLDISEIYAYHNEPEQPLGRVSVREGCMYNASKGLELCFYGAPTHASMPENGRTSAFAVAETVRAVKDIAVMDGYSAPVMCTVIGIDVGTRNFGVQASDGKLLLTIRGERERDMSLLEKRIRQFALQQAEQEGLGFDCHTYEEFPETVNDSGCVKKVIQACGKAGLPYKIAEKPTRGSEDFGHLLKRMKGAAVMIGGGESCAPLHTEAYDFPDKLIESAVNLFTALIDL